jgi:hypothetical protein
VIEALAWAEGRVEAVTLGLPRTLWRDSAPLTNPHISRGGVGCCLRRTSGAADILVWPQCISSEAPVCWTPTPIIGLIGIAGLTNETVFAYVGNQLVAVSERRMRVVHRASGEVSNATLSPSGGRIAWTEKAGADRSILVASFGRDQEVGDVTRLGATTSAPTWVGESSVAWSEPALGGQSLEIRMAMIGGQPRILGRTSRMIRAVAAGADGATLVVCAEGFLRRGEGERRGTEPGLWISSAPFDTFVCALSKSSDPWNLHVTGTVVLAAPSVRGHDLLASIAGDGAVVAHVGGPIQGLAVSPDEKRVIYRSFGSTGGLIEQDIVPLRGR